MPEKHTGRSRLSEGWLRGEDWWGDPVSQNFIKIDMLLHPWILSMTLTQPPEANGIGDMYIVAPGATGDWAAHDGDMTVMTDLGWFFFTPYEGIRIRLDNPRQWMFYDTDTDPPSWQREDVVDPSMPLQGTRYDISVSVGYEAEPRELLLVFVVPQGMTLPAGANLSYARATTPPVADCALTIGRNGTQVGTITFASTSLAGTFSVPIDALFSGGDVLTISMPDNPPTGFLAYATTLRLLLVPT